MRFVSMILILCTVLATGCATAPSVRVDKAPTADLASYKTFGFFDRASTDRNQYTSIVTARLRAATRAQLEKLGYTYDENAPQLRVNFFLNVTDRQEVRATPGGFYGYRRGLYGTWHDLETVEYKAGTLSVDLVDASKKSLVWQGLAEGRVSRESYKQPGPAIDRVVAQIFQSFPKSPTT